MKVLRYTLVFLCFFVLVCNNSYVKANIKIEDPDVQYSEYCAQYELLINSSQYNEAIELCHNYLSQLGYDGDNMIEYYEILCNTSLCYYLTGNYRKSILCASLCLYTLSDKLFEFISVEAGDRIIIMEHIVPIIDNCRTILLYCRAKNSIEESVLYRDLYQELLIDNRIYYSRYNFFKIPQSGIVEELVYNSTLLTKNILLSIDIAFAGLSSTLSSEDIQVAKLYYATSNISDETAKIVYIKQSNLHNFTEHLRFTCENISMSLTQIDIAIEFIFDYTYNYLFCAMLKQDYYPIIIALCPINTIKDFAQKGDKAYNVDNSTDLYNLIWSKLEPYINDGDNVYFAPDGLLY